MMPVDLLRKLQTLLNESPPNESLAVFRGFKAAHPLEQHGLLDVGFDLFLDGRLVVPIEERLIVVALIHGIRTTAGWQERARVVLQREGKVKVVPIGYGYLDVVRFLGPWRNHAIARVERELRDLHRLHSDSDLVVMAHSFGTYVVSKILSKSPDIRMKRLLLCGSIIPEDYRWDLLSNELSDKTCLNEVGTRDFWPVIARVASFGYGGSGSFGFKTSRVLDRFFDYGHSDFFTDEHLLKYWRPFVHTGQVIESPWNAKRPTPPWLLALLGAMPMVKGILLTFLSLVLLGLYWLFAKFG